MKEEKEIVLSTKYANPAPLGLFAFGMTTILLNLHNAGFFALDSMIIAMGIFYGGIAQVIAGIIESKKNNTFGFTAFTSYGFFWLSFAGLLILPKLGLATAVSETGLVAYLTIWGIFTLLLFIGTLKLNRALQLVFATLAALFFLLALGDATGNTSIKTFAGYEGVICGGLAIYAAIAQVLNELHGKTLLPTG
ncbi:acetate uptake transporter [Desertivirga brevis]|uniref:acetate uptake transporter n=1 Tax=Desertivirga brevis TaxID=2810310 RepID=UPI001A95B01B|nr:acetate uptake transporter [Pedobacter sp. SYSU D00873]